MTLTAHVFWTQFPRFFVGMCVCGPKNFIFRKNFFGIFFAFFSLFFRFFSLFGRFSSFFDVCAKKNS